MPRFQINSTDSSMIFLSKNDHLEVGSFVTFRVVVQVRFHQRIQN